jgi:hypothetical protein
MRSAYEAVYTASQFSPPLCVSLNVMSVTLVQFALCYYNNATHHSRPAQPAGRDTVLWMLQMTEHVSSL